MKVTTFVLTMMFVLSTSTAFTQYVISYPYLFNDYYYSYPSLSSSYFTIPRPSDSYQSLRVRGMSQAFAGLIRDNYTDHFQNPAFRLNPKSSEFFSDFGSVNDGGKFLLGSSLNFSQSSLGAFANLSHLEKTDLSNGSSQATSQSTSYNNSSSVMSPKDYGGIVQYTIYPTDNISYGGSYEYHQHDDLNTAENKNGNAYPLYSPPQSSFSINSQKNSKNGHFQKINAGMIVSSETSLLSINAIGEFSSYILESASYYKYYGSPHDSTVDWYAYPTNAKITSGYLSGKYRIQTDNSLSHNFLFELGYTTYDASGMSLEQDSNYYSTYTTRASHSTEGIIFDIKAGASMEKRLSENFATFFGVTLNYINNTADRNDYETTVRKNNSSLINDSTQRTGSIDRNGVEIILPVGAELNIGDYVTIRGGLEPRYRTGELSVIDKSNFSQNSALQRSETQREQRGLSLKENLGLSFKYDDVGEINVLFSNNIADLNTWAFSLRYML